MSVKAQVLAALETAKGRIVSGQGAGRKFRCLRAAVWKAIQLLLREGYPISAAKNKGYCLAKSSDLVSPEGDPNLPAPRLWRGLHLCPENRGFYQ